MTAHVNTLTGRGDGPQGADEVGKRGESFAEGVRWPVDRASIRALFDLGLTVAQIAQYFSIDPVQVPALLSRR